MMSAKYPGDVPANKLLFSSLDIIAGLFYSMSAADTLIVFIAICCLLIALIKCLRHITGFFKFAFQKIKVGNG